MSKTECINSFLLSLKEQGWCYSTFRAGGLQDTKMVSHGEKSLYLWFKFSSYWQSVDKYWFGIQPNQLEALGKQNGGVVLFLGDPYSYVCFPFGQLLELLSGVKVIRDGHQNFHIREHDDHVEMFRGQGGWIDVSQFYSKRGLHKIGLRE